MSSPLPANPSLHHLRQQARTLQRAIRAGDTAAAERAARLHPLGMPADPAEFPLSAALLVVAREYGFPSWSRLKRFVELAAGQAGDAARRSDPLAEVADEFCRLACLTYTAEDDPERWLQASYLLNDQPRLTRSHIWAAAAAAQPGTVGRLLDEEPALARLPGGPYGWSPLFYLAYSRVEHPPPDEMWLASARLLLEAGADPDESHPHPGLPFPLTVLTGVFGEAEDGTWRQPAHTCWEDLADMLLVFGVDVCDPQVLRNRMFRPSSDYLRVLFGQGVPISPDHLDLRPWEPVPPKRADLWRDQLRYAVEHDLVERVSVLVEKGAADHRAAYPDGRTALELAREHGSDTVARYLADLDVPPPERPRLDPALLGQVDDVKLLISAAHAGDRAMIERLVAERPDVVDLGREEMPSLIAQVVQLGGRHADTISLLAEIGFDVDSVDPGYYLTQFMIIPALLQAVLSNDLDLARLLVSLGADPNLRDDAGRTPLDHARRGGQDDMVALLAPVTG